MSGVLVVAIAAVCLLGWLFGVFFGLNYPEITRNTQFIETECIVWDFAEKRYAGACQTTCDTKSCQEYIGGERCEEIHAAGKRNPYALAEQDDLFGGSGRACGDGSSCCRECCDTCEECECVQRASASEDSTRRRRQLRPTSNPTPDPTPDTIHAILAGTTRQRDLSTSCPRSTDVRKCRKYDCNCYCCKRAQDLQCAVSCTMHYETHVFVSILWAANGATPYIGGSNNDQHLSTTIIRDFKADQLGAVAYLAHFERPRSPLNAGGNSSVKNKNSTNVDRAAQAAASERAVAAAEGNDDSVQILTCYYDPLWIPEESAHMKGLEELAFTWEMGYTPGYWVAFGFPAFFVFLLLFAAWHVCVGWPAACQSMPRGCLFKRVKPSSPGVGRLAFALSVAVWWGTILPFVIFLPILMAGEIDHRGADPIALRWTICITAGFGWAPFVTYVVLAKRAAHRMEYARDAGSAGWCCTSLLEVEMAEKDSVGAASCTAYMVVLCNWVIPVCFVAPLGTAAAPFVALAWVVIGLVVGPAIEARMASGEAGGDGGDDGGGVGKGDGGATEPTLVPARKKDLESEDNLVAATTVQL